MATAGAMWLAFAINHPNPTAMWIIFCEYTIVTALLFLTSSRSDGLSITLGVASIIGIATGLCLALISGTPVSGIVLAVCGTGLGVISKITKNSLRKKRKE